jgi:hypothetical protein
MAIYRRGQKAFVGNRAHASYMSREIGARTAMRGLDT